jgi:hypothetical protein
MSIGGANDFIQSNLTKVIPNVGHPVVELDDAKAMSYLQAAP